MIILALDALDLQMVKKYNCKNLMQIEYGQTDISDFELARTVVLWASFLTGKNLENKIPVKNQWTFKLEPRETFFSNFESYIAIDVPAFSLKDNNHAEERRLLKEYFDEKKSVEDYERVVWKNHQENKKDFLEALGKYDIVMAYFDLADAIGHLSFGIPEKMKIVYSELDDLAGKTMSYSDIFYLVISDHGMKPIGRYGDHSKKGFYSSNRKLGLKLPNLKSFYELIKGVLI